MSRMENLRFTDHNLHLVEGCHPTFARVPDVPKFLALEDLRKIFVSPTLITNEKLQQIINEDDDPAFNDLLGIFGDRYFFKKPYHREKFGEFIENKSNFCLGITSEPMLISLFEGKNFKNFLKFKKIATIDSELIIAVSVVTPISVRPLEHGILRDLFGFTIAESRIAMRLHQGLSVREVSEQLGVRVSTVRDQLSSIFAKTQTSRQSALVSILSRLEFISA